MTEFPQDINPQWLKVIRRLQSVARTHLISHGADATNPSGDVGHFANFTAPQKTLKEPRRLVDVQLDVLDFVTVKSYVQRPFTFDARKGFDFEGARHGWVETGGLWEVTWFGSPGSERLTVLTPQAAGLEIVVSRALYVRRLASEI